MGLYGRKEIRVERRNLYNLTDKVLFVYAADGQVLMLVPDTRPKETGKYLIAEGETLERLANQRIEGNKLLRAIPNGLGRNNQQMTSLTLYTDSSYRVYPTCY